MKLKDIQTGERSASMSRKRKKQTNKEAKEKFFCIEAKKRYMRVFVVRAPSLTRAA